MPDIALCRGTGCPLKEGCYRFTAKPDELQSYFAIVPVKFDGTCRYYWDNGKLKPVKKTNSRAKPRSRK